MRITGRTEFYSETGTEGGYWTVVDDASLHGPDDLVEGQCPWGARHCPVRDGSWHEHGDPSGLHALRDGDRLTIFDEDGEVKWKGEVELVQHPPFSEDAFGMWIHADQAGVPRAEWAAMFMKEHRCVLERDE